MNTAIKRLRIFAGPNGSGKTSLYNYLVGIHAFNVYYYINADDIAKSLPVGLDVSNWPLIFTKQELKTFLENSSLQKRVPVSLADQIIADNGIIQLVDPDFAGLTYLAAAIAEFLRIKLIGSGSSFCYETVFSHPSKINEIQIAKNKGYKIYLYAVATVSPEINKERVEMRTKLGGHTVPSEKITARYYRTIENISSSLPLVDKAFFFDNSNYAESVSFSLLAEKKENSLTIFERQIPQWFDEICGRIADSPQPIALAALG